MNYKVKSILDKFLDVYFSLRKERGIVGAVILEFIPSLVAFKIVRMSALSPMSGGTLSIIST